MWLGAAYGDGQGAVKVLSIVLGRDRKDNMNRCITGVSKCVTTQVEKLESCARG